MAGASSVVRRRLWPASLLVSLSAVAGLVSCKRTGIESEPLTQQTAGLIMAGVISADGVMVARAGNRKLAKEWLDKSADEYFKAAKLSPKVGQALLDVYLKPGADDGTWALQARSNNAMLDEEALRLNRMGPAFVHLGAGVSFLRFSFRLFDIEPGKPAKRPFAANSAKMILDNPLAESMFEGGHLIALPDTMKAAFDGIENADLSTYRGAQECCANADRLVMMAKAVALLGLDGLNLVPAE